MPCGIQRTDADAGGHRPVYCLVQQRAIHDPPPQPNRGLINFEKVRPLNYAGCTRILQTRLDPAINAEFAPTMKNPLDSVGATITLGVLFSVLVIVLPQTPDLGGFHHLGLGRWLHIVTGVFWIGLLYYFNVAQIPALAAANADTGGPGGAGIVKYVAPRALLWFRWAALATWLTGAWLLGSNFVNAFTFQPGQVVIGIGAWLGTIMLFNVWALIWPNQKKVIGLVPATDEEKAKARRVATLTSRVNFVLSFPMLLCMGGQTHGLPF